MSDIETSTVTFPPMKLLCRLCLHINIEIMVYEDTSTDNELDLMHKTTKYGS